MPEKAYPRPHDTNLFTSLPKVYLLEGRATPVELPVWLPGFLRGRIAGRAGQSMS